MSKCRVCPVENDYLVGKRIGLTIVKVIRDFLVVVCEFSSQKMFKSLAACNFKNLFCKQYGKLRVIKVKYIPF